MLVMGRLWLNLICKHSPFQMDGIGKAAPCSWKGAYQVRLDHNQVSTTYSSILLSLIIFRTMLEGCLLRQDCAMLRLVLFSTHLPHSKWGSDSIPVRKRQLGPSVAGRFLANRRERHAARTLGRSSTSRPLSHLPGPRSALQI